MEKNLLILMIIVLSYGCDQKQKNISSSLTNIENKKSELFDLYAGPLNNYGPSQKVFSEFGEDAGCKITIIENNTNGNIFLQIKSSSNENSEEWLTYNEGDFLKGQVIYCRATSTSTGGNIKIKIN